MKLYQGLNLESQRLKNDFKYYMENRLFIPMKNTRYTITDLHLEAIKAVMDSAFTLIQAYRGFGKSELITYGFALWRAEMWGESVLILSANETLAHMKLDLIRMAIESENPSLRYMYSGDMSNYTWNRGEIHLIDRNKPIYQKAVDRRTGQEKQVATYNVKAKIFARSMFATNRGIHVPNILCDDVVVEQNSDSYDLIKKTKDIFLEAIVPIRDPDSRMVVVGTPQADDDLLAELKKSMLWKSVFIPALKEDGSPSCPQLHSREFIQQQRILQGERSFQQEYLLRPITEVSSDFTWNILNSSRDFDSKMVSTYSKSPKELVFIGVDYSIKASKDEADIKDSDYFSLVAVAFNTETKKRKVLNLHRERGIEFSEQISLTMAWYYRYSANGLCTEKHAFLEIFNQITAKVDSSIRIIDTGSNKGKFDKNHGIPSMKWEWQQGLWSVPCGDQLSLELTNILFAELNQLESSKHDDMADALFRVNKACLDSNTDASVTMTQRTRKKVDDAILNLRVW